MVKKKPRSAVPAKKTVDEIIMVKIIYATLFIVADVACSVQNASTRHSRRPFADLSGSLYSREDFYTPTQCLGPGCVYETRPNSKYCSEKCGVQLALE